MSESGEALSASIERNPRFRDASAESQFEIPGLETSSPRTSGQPMSTNMSRLLHQEPSVTFVSSKMRGSNERNILGSAGHGLLRFVALPTGALIFVGGMAIDTVIISGMVATGVMALSAPMLAFLALGTAAVLGGIALLDFATGRKKKL